MGKSINPSTGRKGGPISERKKTLVKNKLMKEYVDSGRLSELNKLGFSRDNKINTRTLYGILKEIGDEIKDDNIPELLKVDILQTYERLKSRVQYWWDKCENAPEEEQSFHLEKQVYDEMIKVLKDYRETLIALGVIEKVADRHEVKAIIGVADLQEIENLE